MKILFLQDDFPPFAKGGAGIVVSTLAHEFIKQGWEVNVITTVQYIHQSGSFVENGIQVERIYSNYLPRWRSWRSLYNPSTVTAVKRIIHDLHPDVIHIHNVHYHLSYWMFHLARSSGAKVFFTAHDTMSFHYGKLYEFIGPKNNIYDEEWNYRITPWQQILTYRFWYNPIRNIVIKLLLQNAHKIFAVSNALKEALEQNGIKNVKVLHNGIDASMWKVSDKSVELFRFTYHLTDKKIILFGGRVTGLKGGDIVLSILKDIIAAEPRALLLLVGKKDLYVETFLQKAQILGVIDHIVVTGWISGDTLRAAFHVSNIIIAPSLYLDPLPTVVLEGMACSKAIIGSCFGGIPEMILNNKTGYVLNPFDTAQFKNRIITLLGDERKQFLFGKSGYKRVLENFSLTHQYEQLLHEINHY